jgi:ATP-dependent RNA helicase RhlE
MQTHSFSAFGLSPGLTETVAGEGYETPTEVQHRTIPILMRGENLVATAQTGTGKTAAFVLPLLHRLMKEPGTAGQKQNSKGAGRGGPIRPTALILAPTRELAVQIDESVGTYGARSGIGHAAVFGGASKVKQEAQFRKRPAVLTATPGRLLDFMGEGKIDLSEVRVLIIDEADRMLDMGFIPDVRRIAGRASAREQTALFSATMPQAIAELSREIVGEAERVSVAPEAVTADRVRQSVLHMAREDKNALLPELIRDREMQRVLVFTRTKHRAARLAKSLNKGGIPSDEIHGNRTQNQRQSALERFRSGSVRVLVGTDVAARGIDVDDITHVINFEIPNEPETYVHRIGRTARAGAAGEAISMCDTEELGDFRRIEKLLDGDVSVDRDHAYHKEPERSQEKAASRRGGPANRGARASGNGGSGYPKSRGKGHGQKSGAGPAGRQQNGRSRSERSGNRGNRSGR